ncbi:unnamed protein product [Litomosoides sigmodontis]|uniref:Potassium channel domain-containing protein n=1 Tax=Litomosoides sigmodontis TaxID=42156 RepID=A0A3P6TDZ4_LITSI|nr:unnamed protein product [Litomosoides sigmodontis]
MEPILLRILLVTVVSLYAIFGALILSHLEMPQVDDKLSDIITQSNAVQIFSHMEMMNKSSAGTWQFADSLLFAFALITTIETGDSNEPSNRALILLSLFIIYIIAGSLLLSSYEPEMPFFTAVYFNFITLTSIGLGDIVPQRRSYMVVTILYIIIGLALTTIAIEIAADTLKKLHYFRRKIKNFGNIEIWFGGKRLTVRQIIRNFCDQFNVPDTALSNFNIGNFVEQAIEVEAGERPPLRNSKPRQDVNANGENEFFMKVSTSSEMEPELSSKDEPESNYVTEFTPVPSQELGPEPKHEYESEFETTPEYGSEPELEDEIPLYEFKPPREPTPVTVELEPVPDPELCSLKLEQEMDETPYVPEIMEAPESQSLPPLESVQEQPEVPLSTEEREPERNTPAQPVR